HPILHTPSRSAHPSVFQRVTGPSRPDKAEGSHPSAASLLSVSAATSAVPEFSHAARHPEPPLPFRLRSFPVFRGPQASLPKPSALITSSHHPLHNFKSEQVGQPT